MSHFYRTTFDISRVIYSYYCILFNFSCYYFVVERNAYKILVGKLKGKNNSVELGVDGRTSD
jgi:hypothetical protein